MGLNIQQMRDILRNATGQDEDDIDDTTCDLYLNRAFWEVQDAFPFREREKLATFQTIAGVLKYDIPSGEAIQSLSIMDTTQDTFSHVPLDQIDATDYETRFIDDEDNRGVPTKFVREGCLIRLWPTPADVYTVQIRRLIVLADLSNLNSVPSIPQVWHEIIAYGGVERRFIDLGDINRAALFRKLKGSMMDEKTSIKSEEKQANTQHAGLNYIGRTY